MVPILDSVPLMWIGDVIDAKVGPILPVVLFESFTIRRWATTDGYNDRSAMTLFVTL